MTHKRRLGSLVYNTFFYERTTCLFNDMISLSCIIQYIRKEEGMNLDLFAKKMLRIILNFQ